MRLINSFLSGFSFLKIYPLSSIESSVLVAYCIRYLCVIGRSSGLLVPVPFELFDVYGDVDNLMKAIERTEKFYFEHRKQLNVSLDDDLKYRSHEHEVLFNRLASFYPGFYNENETYVITPEVKWTSIRRKRAFSADRIEHSWVPICTWMYEGRIPVSQLIEILVRKKIKEEPFLLFLAVLQCSRERVLHRDLSILLKAMRSANCNK